MKVSKNFWLRMIPVLVIMNVTLIMSYAVYESMLEREKEICWERLEIATRSTAQKIEVRLDDNLNFLESVSDSFILTHYFEDEERVAEYLISVMENTIFSRIDVILPDNKILTQQGVAYEEILEKGTHISPRKTNLINGKEVIYCFSTIGEEENVQGVLCGTIECDTLAEIFEVFTYAGNSQMFLIDCNDGSYLIDNWHGYLGNIYELGTRKSIYSDEMIDIAPVIMEHKAERLAFVSKTNGENTYQYNALVEGYNWELCVAVQENVVFEHVHKLQKRLLIVGIVEIILIFFFFAWNVWINLFAVRSEEKAWRLELDRDKNESRLKFISNMSHDVRTPINGIVGMLQIIQNHREDDNVVDECLRKIEISTQYLSTLTGDMLDINEIEHNKLILPNEEIDLHAMLKELEIMVEQKAKMANVQCYMSLRVTNPYVMGSPVHIKRILVNLIGNAIKYSSEVGKKVWVVIEDDLTKQEQNQGIYRFTVKDNGIGMTEEFQKHMYNAFEQETVGARSHYEGYGLGLTIVKQLVTRMNGKIELKSEKGVGSTFTVKLPLGIVERKGSNVGDTQKKVQDLTGMHILIVEDNDFNMEIAEVLLSDAGAEVTTAINGKIAVEVFAESKPYTFDLILMDLMMPEMDGCEATEVIRNMERPDAASIPIVAMTASAFSEEIQRCKEAGMNEHIAKPLDINKMIVKLAAYYKKN